MKRRYIICVGVANIFTLVYFDQTLIPKIIVAISLPDSFRKKDVIEKSSFSSTSCQHEFGLC